MKHFQCLKRWGEYNKAKRSSIEDPHCFEIYPTADVYEYIRYICLTVLLSCYYCSFLSYIHVLNGQCTSVQFDSERIDTMLLFFFYFLFIPFFDNVAVDRGTTAVTSILSWKVLGNCQTSRLR